MRSGHADESGKRHKRAAQDVGALQGDLATDLATHYNDLWQRIEERVKGKPEAAFFHDWLQENEKNIVRK